MIEKFNDLVTDITQKVQTQINKGYTKDRFDADKLIQSYFNSSRLSFNYSDLYNIAKHFGFKLCYRDDIHQGLIDNILETIMVILVMRNLQFDTI